MTPFAADDLTVPLTAAAAVLAVGVGFLLARRVRRRRARAARLALLRPEGMTRPVEVTFEELTERLHRLLVSKLAVDRIDWTDQETARADIRMALEHLVDVENPPINRLEREALIREVLSRIPALNPPPRPRPD
jgi:hypothetical protein